MALFHGKHLVKTASANQHTIALWSAEVEFYATGRLSAGDELAVKRVPGERNVADLGAKHLDAKRMKCLPDLMGLTLTERRLGAAGRVATLASCAVVAQASENVDTEAGHDVIGYINTISLVTTVTLALLGLRACCNLIAPANMVTSKWSFGAQTAPEQHWTESPT
jgi:hypothetical protein